MTSRDILVAVGVDDYPYLDIPPLSCAEADARALADTFAGLGLAPERIVVLTGHRATRAEIVRRVGELPRVTAGDRVWFCFSGHGITSPVDGRAHLLVHDTRWDRGRLRDSLVIEEVITALRGDATDSDDLPQAILILDACRNRGMPQARSLGVDLPEGLLAGLIGGVAVFAACPEGKSSYEHKPQGLGLFTATLVDVLRQVPRPRTVAELYDKLLSLTQNRALALGVRQRPSMRIEPAEYAQGVLLFPHLLTEADLIDLRGLAEDLEPLEALPLWRALGRIAPDEQIAEQIKMLAEWTTARRRPPTAPPESATGQDFGTLHDLLKIGLWRDADRETLRLLIRAVGRDPQRVTTQSIDMGELDMIPVEDLHTIDDLWLRHSRGRFGFTPQRRALQEADGDVATFADVLGWRRDRWLFYPEARWSSTAPPGHLPILGPIGGITPPWPLRPRDYLRSASLIPRLPIEIFRAARDEPLARKDHSEPVAAAFGWREYHRLVMTAGADVYAQPFRNARVEPALKLIGEGARHGYLAKYPVLLSVIWAITRVHLLCRFAAEDTGIAQET